MKRNKVFFIGLLLNLLPFLIGTFYYEKLPETMATHFNFSNEANGFSGKNMALFGLPAILVLTYLVAYFFMTKDPKRENHNEKLVSFILLFIPVLNILVCSAMISFNLGNKINLSKWLLLGLGVIFVVVGNYMPKMKRNYTIGIKLPWTLHSDVVWEKTHRMAGYLWMFGGVLIIPATLFLKTSQMEIVLPSIIGIVVLIPSVYSYLVYQKEKA